MTRRRPTEAAVLAAVRVEASRLGLTLFRNSVGMARGADGRVMRFGLHPGSSDLIGWMPRVIGGQRVAVFVAIEIKRPGGRLTAEQRRFIDAVLAAGGIGIVCDDPAALARLLGG